MKRRITGSFVALITPMNKDFSLDFGGFTTLLDFQRDHGTSAVLLMGSSGEVSMLSREERHSIVETTMGHRDPDMEMWFGCTGPTTEETIDYVRHAAGEGADGAIIAAPPYISAGTDDIVRFFLDVADASPIPLGIYNNPPRVKTDLTADDVLTLAKHPNVLVLKESTSRVGQVAEIAAAEPDLSLMCCCSPNLGLIVPTMSLGGHGTANVTGNIIPEEMAVISTPWQDFEDATRFRESYVRNLPMLQFAYSAVNPIPAKSLLGAVGMPAGPLRRPLRALEGAALEGGIQVARDLGLDRRYGYKLS